MPATVESRGKFKCTYEDCNYSFGTEEHMKKHKKFSTEHDYCHKCDEDFHDYDDYVQHKIFKPDEHGKACRVCGEEFKSLSGLRRHIEITHKIDQALVCIGCKREYYRASLLIEHFEFGHCEVVSPDQFYGHIVHKHLITDLLRDNRALARFKQKQIKFDAAQDHESEGGVSLVDNAFGNEDLNAVPFKAIEPIAAPDPPLSEATAGPYPPLPSRTTASSTTRSSITGSLSKLSLNDSVKVSTTSGRVSSTAGSTTIDDASTVKSHNTTSTQRQSKAWGARDGKTPASKALFPNAKPNPAPAPSDFSIASYDQHIEKVHGVNMFRIRFWDPNSSDWNPERFYDAITNKYYCPFICEQTFPTVPAVIEHVRNDHRIVRMKCPMCHKTFRHATALMAHCESRSGRCDVSKARDFNIFLDRMTGGFLSVEEKVRDDHAHISSAELKGKRAEGSDKYVPPVATCLKYTVTTPPDWKDPAMVKVIGGFPVRGALQ